MTDATSLSSARTIAVPSSLGTRYKTANSRKDLSMSDRDSGPVAAVRGVIEDAIGKAKEIIGIVISHEGLRKEGRAQQDKAKAQRDVAKKETQAEAARAAAGTAEARQKAAQK